MLTNAEAKQLGMPNGVEFREGRFLVVGGGHTVQTNLDDEPLYPIGVKIINRDVAPEDSDEPLYPIGVRPCEDC